MTIIVSAWVIGLLVVAVLVAVAPEIDTFD